MYDQWEGENISHYLFHLPFSWSVFWKRKRGEVEVNNFQNIANIFGLRPLFLLQVHEVADYVKFEFIVDAFGTSVEKLQDFLTGYCLKVNSLYLS